MKKIMTVCAVCMIIFLANCHKETKDNNENMDNITTHILVDSDADGVPQICDHSYGECNFRK